MSFEKKTESIVIQTAEEVKPTERCKRLAGFRLHNVAATPLRLATSSQPAMTRAAPPQGWGRCAQRSWPQAGWGSRVWGGGGRSGKIHGGQCVVVDLDSFGQR